ncbi:MAG: Sir2 family NAD-dependent protein deacetylase [Verrucomicrobiota bacterium]
MNAEIHKAAELIAQADHLLITAGAGMSVDSGLPDYRGKEGLWNHYPVYRELGVDYAAMTRPSGFERDPHFAWGFYGHLLNLYRKALPHEGYSAMLEIAQPFGGRAFALTSNVDGLFLKAGFSSDHLRECHGSIHRLQCIHPCQRTTWSAEGFMPEIDPATRRLLGDLPRCPHCGSAARPAVFAFGDTKYVWESTHDQTTRYQAWKARVQNHRLVVLECGSGPTVPGLRREGESLVRQHGGHLIRINLRDSSVIHPEDIGIAFSASEALCIIQRQIASLASFAAPQPTHFSSIS